MKVDIGRAVSVGFVISILFLSITVIAADETEFQVESTNLQIYRDGLVRVTQTWVVNETFPVVTLPLLASSVDNIVVLDENQTLEESQRVLDYEIEGSNLDVFTFGATNISLQYDTGSLTIKEFDIWSLIVDTPYNLTVLLPEDSTIIDLSEMPTSIDTEGNKITLSLSPSQWEISYVFPLVSPAEFQVSDIKVTPLEVKGGEEVTVSIKITNVGEQSGSHTLSLLINQTTEETRTVTLDKGESTTEEFKVTKQTPGTYNVEIDGLLGEFTVREGASNGTPSNGTPPSETPSNGEHTNSIPLEYLAVAAIVVGLVLFAAFVLVRRRGTNVENIFREHPHLNNEDKEVIRFLAEKEGKAFEAEIRERFPDIPRTSLWRLVRRLEKMEIVKVKKIGLENRVELKE